MKNILEDLRKIAIKFQIDPKMSIGHAARIDTVIRVLNNINKSYKSFLKIEFDKNDDYKKIFKDNEKIIKQFLDELDLLIVDVKFDSFSSALAPNIFEKQIPLFKSDTFKWKKEVFSQYKEKILYGNYDDTDYIKTISKRYNEEEKNSIFSPLFSGLNHSRDYDILLLSEKYQPLKKFNKPKAEKIKYYIKKKEDNKKNYKTIQTFMKVKTDKNGNININKKNLEEVYYIEELPHETYPYKPENIDFNGNIYILKNKIDCEVGYDADMYLISNDELDITVWGETRDEAEEAFCFAFGSLYENYAKEKNKNLTKTAIKLKNNLLEMVDKVVRH